MRLQKYLSRCGVASRRSAEKMIADGRVSVNGQVVTKLGTSVDETEDEVCVDSKKVEIIKDKALLILNKPCGYVTTMSDPQRRHIVSELVDTEKFKGIFPVGRLDINTSGLLLMTNDGDLCSKLMHPSSLINKTYIAEVIGKVSAKQIERLRNGVNIGWFTTAPAKVRILSETENTTTLEIVIHEGKNRQVRRMCSAVGHHVVNLKRIRYANLNLNGIEEGHYREATDVELCELRAFFDVELNEQT